MKMIERRYGIFPYILLFLILLILVRRNVIAQEPSKDSVSYNLPEIVVTASPILIPSPSIVREYNTKDFESWNAHNVAEALAQSVGLNVQVSSSTGDARVFVRGFRQRDVQVLFDGIPISTAYEGNLDLNEITINNIAKIKMIKATPSVIYGINVMGCVIDIVPKTGSNSRIRYGAVEIGKHHARLFRGSFGGQNKIINYFVSANHEAADGYSLSRNFSATKNEDGGLRENSDYSRNNFFVHLSAKIQPIGNYSIFYDLSDNDRGFPPQAGVINPDYIRQKESKRQTIGVVNSFSFIPVSVRLFYNRYDSKTANYLDSTYSEIELFDDAKDYVYGANIYSKHVISKNNIMILNLTFKNDGYESEGDLENLNEANVRTYTIAAEDEISIKDRLSISVGGIFGTSKQTQADKSISVFDGQIVVGYEIKQNVIAHVSMAKRARFPTLREFYRKKYGNPNLKEQKSTNYELGVTFGTHPRIKSDLAFFLSKLDGLIERITVRSIYENLQMATIKGVEFSSGGWISNYLFGRIGYAYLEADEIFSNGLSRPLRNRPKHAADLELRYRFPFNTTLNLNGIYVAEVFDYDDNENLYRLPNYFVLNTKISHKLMRGVDAYVAVSNITDENYEHRLGFPREGRAGRLGINIEF